MNLMQYFLYSEAPFNLTIWKNYRQIKRGVKLIETFLQNSFKLKFSWKYVVVKVFKETRIL
jgi:hypothetical protein